MHAPIDKDSNESEYEKLGGGNDLSSMNAMDATPILKPICGNTAKRLIIAWLLVTS